MECKLRNTQKLPIGVVSQMIYAAAGYKEKASFVGGCLEKPESSMNAYIIVAPLEVLPQKAEFCAISIIDKSYFYLKYEGTGTPIDRPLELEVVAKPNSKVTEKTIRFVQEMFDKYRRRRLEDMVSDN